MDREDIQLELNGWEEAEAELRTRWRFSAILQLPWRPRLAAAGGTTHVFSPARLPTPGCCTGMWGLLGGTFIWSCQTCLSANVTMT